MGMKWMQRLLWPTVSGGTPEPGLYHYREERDGRVRRYHLRIDADGAGVLTVDARGLCRLSPVGVMMAQGLLGGEAPASLGARVARAFRGRSVDAIHDDLRDLQATLKRLSLGRAGAVRDLDGIGASPFARSLSAPLCADVEVGTLQAGRAVVDRLRAIGVPQVVWVLGDEPAPEHLPELVERAEDQGLICGLRTRASALPLALLERAIEAGLDHLDLLFLPEAELHAAWLGEGDREAAGRNLALAREAEIGAPAVVALRPGEDEPAAAIEALRSFGFRQAAFHALLDPEGEAGRALPQLAVDLEEALTAAGFPGQWGPPHAVPAAAHPKAARRGPRTVGEVTVRVLAGGEILPPTGAPNPVGNLLGESWARLWQAPAFTPWREASEAPERCPTCPGLEICEGGCPAEAGSWASSGEVRS
ncbi:MAG: hypothetical protein P1V51_04065 [Deltaproteobacteria bacterium]|nr:hypothetical protein [Deltaproteobacteria bacterium]